MYLYEVRIRTVELHIKLDLLDALITASRPANKDSQIKAGGK